MFNDAEKLYFEKKEKKPVEGPNLQISNCDKNNSLVITMQKESVWLDKFLYDEAEREYFANKAKLLKIKEMKLPAPQPKPIISFPIPLVPATEKRFKVKDKRDKNKKLEQKNDKLNKEERKVSSNILKNTLAGEVAKARQHIKSSLEFMDGIRVNTTNTNNVELNNRINTLEKENKNLKKDVQYLTNLLKGLELRLLTLEKSPSTPSSPTSSSAQSKPKIEDDEDDGVDLFGSDSEDEDADAKKVKEQRLAEYAAKKSKKPVLIAKSNIILDVKPWDDETNMKVMEAEVRKIECDGLIWGASKLVPLAFGIHKLQISCVVEDDKVSVDWLQETIEAIEDFVQSVDIAAFNKV
uniref:Translation elongation factor EF1B beta/delta subunit guanine nucleotide exchange domain-containing protein n=1 Tax=Clastoptera arizonana TaxID=38151 RepID=A0A1B6D4S5_9HEMI